MARVLCGSRMRIAAVLLLSCSLLLSGIATEQARAGRSARSRAAMLQLTNEARRDEDLTALELDRELSMYAVRHSRQMAEEGELFHTADLAGLLEGYAWSMGGENVGVGSTLGDIQAAFMGSPPHRGNILTEGFDHTAIGVARSDGNLWVTVIFYG